MTFRLKARDHLGDASLKRAYNRELFRHVAPRYAIVTRALSFGRDAAWKRALVRALPDLAAPACLDLATGTGDIAALLAERYPAGRIVALDLSAEMLERARRRLLGARIEFRAGDMSATGLPAGSLDIVTGGYAIRNAPDLGEALREIHRLLRPGGIAALLDFARSDSPAIARAQIAALRSWGGLWGILLHGTPEVYTYIAASLARFPSRSALASLLEQNGFRIRYRQSFMAGIIDLITVEKG